MKRLTYLLAVLLAVASIAMPALPVRAQTSSLIANPSVETTDGAAPANWTANRWGNNTATLSHIASEGYSGSKSLRIDMTSHTDGDAKWMADAVTISPSTSYTYTSFYKSNVATEIDLQYTDTSGNVSYAYAQSVPANTAWTPVTVTFTTPANAAKVVVMHVVAAAGWLQTDEFSLAPTVVAPPAADENLIANASFETANGATPAGWTSNGWGANTPQFTYETSGRTGDRSVKATLTSHTDGDAKWYANPVTVTPGKNYTYTDYYKATVSSRIVAAFIESTGNYTYQELTAAGASSDWAQHEVSFTAPANATKVTIFHLVDSVGTLTIDDVSLAETHHDHEDEENLVANASLETANGVSPADWQSNKWGANTATFTYENTGRTGGRSITTAVTSHTDGDAKWYFDAVDVIAGKTYVYRDYYKATATTRTVAAFIDTSGNYSYVELGDVAAAADWTLYEASFVVPANAAKATVFHLVDKAGTLTIDDVLLQVAVPPATDITVPNGSVEQGSATPTNWQSNKWGSHTANFQYVTDEGRTGNKSIKVTVSNYTDGDAKWFFDPIDTLTPGQQYRFTTWYKGTAIPHAVALYLKADGSEQYVGLPSPQTNSATEWQKYSDTFTVPEDVVGVSVFMFVAQNGWLQTDDYSITAYHPNGFNRPLVSLTFDDGHEDNVNTALPILNSYGFKSTQCYATDFLEGRSQQIINGALAFYNSGHEICSHTVTHPFLTSLNSSSLHYELQHSKEYLESLIGAPVRNFATPYGDYNANVLGVIDDYYQSHRTVDEGFNSKDNFDIYRLRVQNVLDTTTAAQVQGWIEQAQADNTWLILVYHRVANDPGPYDSYIDGFADQMAVIAASGITVKTYQAALEEILPQL